MRKDIDKEFIFPPTRPQAVPQKRSLHLVPLVLFLIFLGMLIYLIKELK